jgi:hypothetical protein
VAYTVIWYGKQGIVEKVPFDAEKAARDHALATFPARKEVYRGGGSSQGRRLGYVQPRGRRLKPLITRPLPCCIRSGWCRSALGVPQRALPSASSGPRTAAEVDRDHHWQESAVHQPNMTGPVQSRAGPQAVSEVSAARDNRHHQSNDDERCQNPGSDA